MEAPVWPAQIIEQEEESSGMGVAVLSASIGDEDDDLPPIIEDGDDFVEENEIDDTYASFLAGQGIEVEESMAHSLEGDEAGGSDSNGCIIL